MQRMSLRDFFKLTNNSVFGETTENSRNHKDMKLLISQEKYAEYVMKPNFKDGYPFLKELLIVETGKTEIKMNKPVYLRQAILDLSKMLMCEFHYGLCYDYMQPVYGR